MILVLKTDTPEVYVALFQDGQEKVAKTWEAGRELSIQLLTTIESLCKECDMTLTDIKGIVVFQGPGSYTGLRISISTANAIGSSLNVAVVGASGESWLDDGFSTLAESQDFTPVTPVYGGDVYTTKPRK
jgi:tRNA threonylcarbamoyladenosine biosynthesis protein TsaB